MGGSDNNPVRDREPTPGPAPIVASDGRDTHNPELPTEHFLPAELALISLDRQRQARVTRVDTVPTPLGVPAALHAVTTQSSPRSSARLNLIPHLHQFTER